MSLRTYLKYQTLCLLRSHNLVATLLSVANQILAIFLAWKYLFSDLPHESIGIAISVLFAMTAIFISSGNLFAWHYNSNFLLFVSPVKVLQRTPSILGLLCNLVVVGVIQVVIFLKIRPLFTPEKQTLFALCLFAALVVSVPTSLFGSVRRAMPIKKNAFSFSEKTPQIQGNFEPKVVFNMFLGLIPIIVFYTVGQNFLMFWYVFVVLYAAFLLGWLWKQLQSFPQKAYDARFHLYQSLKG